MSLSPYVLVIGTKSDDLTGFNVIPNAAYEIRFRNSNGTSGSLANIFEDEAGSLPITQTGATVDSRGSVTFYADAIPLNAVYNNGVAITQAIDIGISNQSLNNAIIGDESTASKFNTVQKYKDHTSILPVGKRIYLADRNAYFNVIAGTVGANDKDLIASTSVSQSIDLVVSTDTTALSYGDATGDNTDTLIAAVASLKANGFNELKIPYSSVSLTADVDCNELVIIGGGTTIPNTNTLVNHGGMFDCIISGVDTSKRTLHPTPSITFRKPKVLRKFSANEYRGYTIANDGRGIVEATWRDDIVDGGASSIGGTSAFRITKYRNINSLAMLESTVTASNLLGASFTRTFGEGAGGDVITYHRADPAGGWLEFDVGTTPLTELSIAAILTTGGSRDIEVTSQPSGKVLGTFDLEAASETQVAIKFIVQNVIGTVRLTNNDASRDLTIAGVNYFLLTEDNAQGDIDKIVYSFNPVDYTINQGANDFALARFNDKTGGSFHGGETVNSDTFTVDGVTEVLVLGGVQYGFNIRHTTNVTITWPSDSATVNVVRIESLADGMMKQIKEFALGSLIFSSVWTMMSETNYALGSVRLTEEKGIGVGASPLHTTYDRTNAIQQDAGLTTVLTNYFTVFDNEANSNGGLYITDNSPSNVRKAYYGPVLFNKRVVGDITAEQITVFGL